MSESVKNKPAIGMYWSLASIILGVASMISYYVLSMDGENSPAIVYVLAAAAVVIQAVVLVLNRTPKGAASYNLSSLLSAILIAFALEQMMLGRVEWLGGVAAHNANFAPIGMSFYLTVALFILAILVSVVAAFLRQQKVESAA